MLPCTPDLKTLVFTFFISHICLRVLNCKLTVQRASAKYCNEYTAIAVHIIEKVREPFFHNSALSGTGLA